MLIENVEVVDLCGGPGGWDTGMAMLDPDLHAKTVGIEWDDAACLTREAAGHRTLKGDIAEVVPLTFRGCRGLIASPPCTLFSQAGTGIGRELIDLLASAIWRILHGEDCRAEVREAVYPTCHAAQTERNRKRVERGKLSWTPERLEKAARDDAYIACLVLEPARYIRDLDGSLEWLAFEQVPAVLPLWKLYATALRKMGWSVWCGVLNAADYGVPQTRTRAILIGRRTGAAQPPEATHAENPTDDLFGAALPKWVSMAEALGWQRARVGFGRKDDRGDSPDGLRERDFRDSDEPAFTLTEKARSWVRHDVVDDGIRWRLRGSAQPRATVRDQDEPAPTLHFGHDAAQWKWLPADDPDTDRWMVGAGVTGEGRPRASSDPAPTQTGKGTAYWLAARESYGTSAKEGLRVTAEEAGVVQAFPADYPWRGTRTKIFEQIGNAVPPQLAAHVLAAALGRRYEGGPVLASVPRDVPVSGLANNSQANAARRSLDEPAGTVFFGARLNTVVWDPE